METLLSTPSPGAQNNHVAGGFHPSGQHINPNPNHGPDFYGREAATFLNFSGILNAYPTVIESLLETTQAMVTNGPDAWGQTAPLVSHPAGGVGRGETTGLSAESLPVGTDNAEFPNPKKRKQAKITTRNAKRALNRRSHRLDPQRPIQVGTV